MQNNFVLLMMNGGLRAKLTQQRVTQFDTKQFDEIRNYFAEALESTELDSLMIQLRNCLLFGDDSSIYEICHKDEEGNVYTMLDKGRIARVFEDNLYIEATAPILKSIIDTIKTFPATSKYEEYWYASNCDRYHIARFDRVDKSVFIPEANVSIPIHHKQVGSSHSSVIFVNALVNNVWGNIKTEYCIVSLEGCYTKVRFITHEDKLLQDKAWLQIETRRKY